MIELNYGFINDREKLMQVLRMEANTEVLYEKMVCKINSTRLSSEVLNLLNDTTLQASLCIRGTAGSNERIHESWHLFFKDEHYYSIVKETWKVLLKTDKISAAIEIKIQSNNYSLNKNEPAFLNSVNRKERVYCNII